MTSYNRRDFLRCSARTAGTVLLAPSLSGLVACSQRLAATSRTTALRRAGLGEGGYGALRPAGPELALPR